MLTTSAAPSPADRKPPSARLRGGIRVMIVDDSLTVRTIFKRMVESDRDMVTGNQIYPYLPEGFLLRDPQGEDETEYHSRWVRARPDSFRPFDDGV